MWLTFMAIQFCQLFVNGYKVLRKSCAIRHEGFSSRVMRQEDHLFLLIERLGTLLSVSMLSCISRGACELCGGAATHLAASLTTSKSQSFFGPCQAFFYGRCFQCKLCLVSWYFGIGICSDSRRDSEKLWRCSPVPSRRCQRARQALGLCVVKKEGQWEATNVKDDKQFVLLWKREADAERKVIHSFCLQLTEILKHLEMNARTCD